MRSPSNTYPCSDSVWVGVFWCQLPTVLLMRVAVLNHGQLSSLHDNFVDACRELADLYQVLVANGETPALDLAVY